MVSKTRMFELVKSHDAACVAAALAESPDLLAWRDERGRNWLHVCCGAAVKGDAARAEASVETAKVLLAAGLPIDQEAFREGDWKATPLWYAVGRGENLTLAEFLLNQGCNPNYCLWAASFGNDLEAIRLLVRHGADLEDPSAGDSPFLGAVKWSHFGPAEELLKLGADVNARDAAGLTALHLMLKKASDRRHFAMLIAHGARGDIPDPSGLTARDIMRRKKDPEFRAMAEQLG
ncbi:MAG: ankyrin repeat domain-containing protein [Caulobacterales bacterium]